MPTLKLKLFACTVSGALMGAAGAPMPMYLSFIEPASSFSLNWGVSALAMPMIGGTAHWIGPVVGALLLGSIQQIVTVTISNEINVLVVGVLLVLFVVLAPEGIVGPVQEMDRVPQGKEPVEALRRLHRAERREPRDRAGRALRPDRPERLGQDHAHQLHLGRAAQRRRARSAFRARKSRSLPAYRRTRLGIARSFQIPRPFHSMSVLENLLVPSAYVVHLREARARPRR